MKALTQRSAWGRHAGVLLVLPTIVVVLGFYVLPAVFNIVLSVRDVSIFNMSQWGTGWAGLGNLRKLLDVENIGHILWNTTVWLTAVTVVVRVVLGLGLAILLDSALMRRRGVSVIARALVILPWTVPPVAAVLVWQFLLQPNYGAINQVLAGIGVLPPGGIPWLQQIGTVWIAIDAIVVWRELPLSVLLFLAGLQTINPELYEAARVDGAGWWRQITSITIPLLKPVTVVVVLLTIIWTYSNFVYVWLTTRGGPGNATDVLGTAIYRQGFAEYDIGLSAVTAVVGMLIMACFAVVYFVRVFESTDD